MANILGSVNKRNLPRKKRDTLVGLARKNKSVWRDIVTARAAVIAEAIKKNKNFAKAVQKAQLREIG